MKCSNCNENILDEDRFCGNCGTKIISKTNISKNEITNKTSPSLIKENKKKK